MAIENLKKHAGQLVNTGVRVAVVFRKLPNDDNNCLIVETERLPDSYHDYMMQCLNSREASETNEFYELLNRRTFPDGLNCLTALHSRGFLRKEPVSNVNMIPLPGKAVPLALINATIDKKLEEYMAKQTTEQNKDVQKTATATTALPEAVVSGDPVAIARGLLLQADLLEKEAKAKKLEAYAMAPELKPGRGRPTLTENEKLMSEHLRKEKRRERDRKKAKELKESKVSDIDLRVQAKIQRDELRTE
jgi:hypothetical protein